MMMVSSASSPVVSMVVLEEVLDSSLQSLKKLTTPLTKGEKELIGRFKKDCLKAKSLSFDSRSWFSFDDFSWALINKAVVVYTDASLNHETGAGAYSWFKDPSSHLSEYTEGEFDVNKLELLALLSALEKNPGKVLLVSDASLYSLTTSNLRKKLTPLQAKKLDSFLLRLKTGSARLTWVKGHAACTGNVCADILSVTNRIVGWHVNHPEKVLLAKEARSAVRLYKRKVARRAVCADSESFSPAKEHRREKSRIEEACSSLRKIKGRSYTLQCYFVEFPKEKAKYDFCNAALQELKN